MKNFLFLSILIVSSFGCNKKTVQKAEVKEERISVSILSDDGISIETYFFDDDEALDNSLIELVLEIKRDNQYYNQRLKEDIELAKRDPSAAAYMNARANIAGMGDDYIIRKKEKLDKLLKTLSEERRNRILSKSEAG